jgi:hypothetical protein
MQKIINAHCHIYPVSIAAKAVEGIKNFYSLNMSLDGTTEGLIRDGEKVGVVHYLVHSVATTPKQVKSINEFISGEVKTHPGLFTGFGTLHPDSPDLEGDYSHLLEQGLKGVKLHPDFQRFALDGEQAFAIGRVISRNPVPLLIHCGDYRYNYSNPKQLKAFLTEFPNLTVIGAHFAGWSVWKQAAEELAGIPNLFVDCTSSLYRITSRQAADLVHAYGADKVIWGTDYPMWESEKELEMFHNIGLTPEEEELILYRNAAELLKINY